MGTTVATNALLERKGEPTLLVTTRGFRDAAHRLPEPAAPVRPPHRAARELLYSAVVGGAGRIGAGGDVVAAAGRIACAKSCSPQTSGPAQRGHRVHARLPLHGARAAAAHRARWLHADQRLAPRNQPLMKFVSRGDTTVVDAYLSPILRRYVEQVAAEMPGVKLFFMQSSGGLTGRARLPGQDAILSGPAGGIVGMVRQPCAGIGDAVIGFDMGGTSTDVNHATSPASSSAPSRPRSPACACARR